MDHGDRKARPWWKMPRGEMLVFVITVLALGFSLSAPLQAGSSITPEQAIHFIGTYQTVCGKVVSTKYATEKTGSPTFLNLDRPYPEQVFTALIWGEHRRDFHYLPEVELVNKPICVSGMIQIYKGRAEVILSEPSQITVTH